LRKPSVLTTRNLYSRKESRPPFVRTISMPAPKWKGFSQSLANLVLLGLERKSATKATRARHGFFGDSPSTVAVIVLDLVLQSSRLSEARRDTGAFSELGNWPCRFLYCPPTNISSAILVLCAGPVAELADAHDLGSCPARGEGSSPFRPTKPATNWPALGPQCPKLYLGLLLNVDCALPLKH
jgi:hypothetical protein